MDSKLEKLKREAKKLDIELDANETIADLEAKISCAKSQTGNVPKDGAYPLMKDEHELLIPRRGRVIKNINFTRRVDREAKKNG